MFVDIRAKIREVLELRDMRPVDLARSSGVSAGLISDLLNGKRDGVTLNTATKLASALGVNVLYLVEDDTLGPAVILEHLSKEEQAFVMNKHNAPFIKLTKKAAKEGLTPEQLDFLIKAILKHSK